MSTAKLRVAANISDGFLFSEVGPMPQRYIAAADAGFNAVSKLFQESDADIMRKETGNRQKIYIRWNALFHTVTM